MGQPTRRTFVELLLSPTAMVPVILGLCSALAVWGFGMVGPASTRVAIFLAVVGCRGGGGTVMTLLVLGGRRSDPAVEKKRRELLAALDAMADGVQHGPLPEPDLATAAAPIERA
jgi:hypothetical protein